MALSIGYSFQAPAIVIDKLFAPVGPVVLSTGYCHRQTAVRLQHVCARVQVVFMPLLLQIVVKMLGAWDSGKEAEKPAYASTGLPADSTGAQACSLG